jgi:hypothetical protein
VADERPAFDSRKLPQILRSPRPDNSAEPQDTVEMTSGSVATRELPVTLGTNARLLTVHHPYHHTLERGYRAVVVSRALSGQTPRSSRFAAAPRSSNPKHARLEESADADAPAHRLEGSKMYET